MIRASASQSVDLEFIFSSRVISKDFKKCYSQLPCMELCTKRIAWRIRRQAGLLCPWAMHLKGCLHLYVAERWRGQAVYLPWWPSLAEDSRAEHELLHSGRTSSCIIVSTIPQIIKLISKKRKRWNQIKNITSNRLIVIPGRGQPLNDLPGFYDSQIVTDLDCY